MHPNLHRADKLVVYLVPLVCVISLWPLPVCTETHQKPFWDGPMRLRPAHGMCAIFFPWCLAQQHFINIWFCSEGHGLFCFPTLKYKLNWPHLRFSEGDRDGRLPPAQLAAGLCGDGSVGGAGGGGRRAGMVPFPFWPCCADCCLSVGIPWASLAVYLYLFPASTEW